MKRLILVSLTIFLSLSPFACTDALSLDKDENAKRFAELFKHYCLAHASPEEVTASLDLSKWTLNQSFHPDVLYETILNDLNVSISPNGNDSCILDVKPLSDSKFLFEEQSLVKIVSQVTGFTAGNVEVEAVDFSSADGLTPTAFYQFTQDQQHFELSVPRQSLDKLYIVLEYPYPNTQQP
ncbi:MAG: hypothetical protein HWE11_12390 [Gammaproteobacteria bacterium]|nr:hypothetical protein [Gammaproteobacteria bacterium]